MPKDPVLLAFDFGLRRIGVAVGQTITQSATPLPVLAAQKGRPDWQEISELINLWQPSALLVGLPYQMDGGEQAISFAARQFARELKARFNLPVHLTDERLTTREAKRRLAESGLKPQNYPPIDSFAAKLILESWMIGVNLSEK
jgi:putative holliday junction resolvase